MYGSLTLDIGMAERTRVSTPGCGKHIAVLFAPRREGDVPSSYACPDLAHEILGWRATRDLNEMCKDAWKWQSDNPEGYGNQ